MICVGNTFLMETPPNYTTEHLFIVIAIKNGKAILVNITSNSSDGSCSLTTKDHPFVRHNSSISYKDAMVSDICDIEAAVKSKVIAPHTDVSRTLLKKIQEGAKISQNLKPEYLLYL